MKTKWKLGISVLAAGLLFSACGTVSASVPSSEPAQSAPASSAFQETTDPNPDAQIFQDMSELPVIDGSTACLPLIARVISDSCGVSKEIGEDYACANKTAQSWINLVDGYADLLLVYEMPESSRRYWQENGEEPLEITPIGRDALVFMVNEQNPLESLTQDQLRDIYSGTITDWSELGGSAGEIAAFQRDESSGSQTLFVKLLMGDTPLMEAPTELRPGMMNMLVEGLADYNNSGNAIGYSVYYYISEMYNQPGLRLLGVDGVVPSEETIGDGSYPLTNEFYVAIRASEPEDSPARKLYNWMTGEHGTNALLAAGYVPAQ